MDYNVGLQIAGVDVSWFNCKNHKEMRAWYLNRHPELEAFGPVLDLVIKKDLENRVKCAMAHKKMVKEKNNN